MSSLTLTRGRDTLHPRLAGFARAMNTGARSMSMLVMGDSTGAEADEWPTLLTTAIANRWPSWAVHLRSWDTTNLGWNRETVVGQGTAGAGYLDCNGSTAYGIGSVDNARIQITTDFTLQAKLYRSSSWTAQAGRQTVAARIGGTGAWHLEMEANGKILVEWWTTGGAANQNATSTVAVPFAVDTWGWIRAEIDLDNGAGGRSVSFFTSTDGTTWTQLGTTVTTAGTSSLNGTPGTGIALGTQGGQIFNGRIGEFDLFAGITTGKQLRASWRPAIQYGAAEPEGWHLLPRQSLDICGNSWVLFDNAFTDGRLIPGAPILTVLNGSSPGQVLSYFSEAGKFAQMTDTLPKVVHLSLGHNEGSGSDSSTWLAAYVAHVAALRAKIPDVAIVVHLQNPKYAPVASQYRIAHHDRQERLSDAIERLQAVPVDAYGTFLARGGSSLVSAVDGTHPTTAGRTLWASLTRQQFGL